MATMRPARRAFDVELIQDDMTDRGWYAVDLARAIRMSESTVSRFLSGETRSPRIAALIAGVFGRSVREYVVGKNKRRAKREKAVA